MGAALVKIKDSEEAGAAQIRPRANTSGTELTRITFGAGPRGKAAVRIGDDYERAPDIADLPNLPSGPAGHKCWTRGVSDFAKLMAM